MKRITAVITLAVLVMGAFAQKPTTGTQNRKTSNTLAMEHIAREHKNALDNLQQAQAAVQNARDRALWLQGAMEAMQLVIDNEQTSSPGSMPPLP